MAEIGYVVERCNSCRYYLWQPRRGARCRRFPPLADGLHVATAEDNWCGEWKEPRKDQPMFLENERDNSGSNLPAVRRPRGGFSDVG